MGVGGKGVIEKIWVGVKEVTLVTSVEVIEVPPFRPQIE